MNKSVLFGALTIAGVAAGAAAAGTLDDVKARGKLNCGVTTGLAGFAAPDATGEWKGIDQEKITLLDTIRNAKATVLIGATGQAGAFSEEILSALKESAI